MAGLREEMTVVVTTSATRSNPDTQLLRSVMHSFGLVDGLTACRTIVVCDGFRPKDGEGADSNKRGLLTADRQQAYVEYIATLQESTDWYCQGQPVEVMALTEHAGFAGAVLKAVETVTTPFLMVVQHDWAFVRAVDVSGVLDVMSTTPRVRYCTFMAGKMRNYLQTVRSIPKLKIDLRPVAPDHPVGERMYPLGILYDRTHVCRVEFWNEWIRTGIQRCRVRRAGARGGRGRSSGCVGNFPEDLLGREVRSVLEEGGQEALMDQVGTSFLCDSDDAAVVHMDGRKFLSEEELAARGWRGRACRHQVVAAIAGVAEDGEPMQDVESGPGG
mmetsp:Transcript_87770/g.200594  ORF Transcript_87770/g.200594 Transcript_87770/m.200594 type:complete len:330 (+) Transcript_87770:54-1043(+)